MGRKGKAPDFKKVSRPKPQTLETPGEVSLHEVRPSPRFSFHTGDRITDELAVIGHLYIGNVAELYQVWSTTYTCALTCKLMLPGFRTNSFEARAFKREAALLRRLNHPNIVRLFGGGDYQGRPFLLQEYLHGPSLLDLIDSAPDRRTDVQQAIKAIIHVCAAVDHLHSHGYVHRDIKPANIIVRGGLPILIDLGSAFRLQPGRKPRRAIGTDPYMAPEQCLKAELSERTDVYQLAAVLYEMLAGRWPFEDELIKSRSEALEGRFPQITKNHPPSVRKFNASVSAELDCLILKSMAKDPDKRVSTVRELVRNLAGFLEKEEQLWPESLNDKAQMV
ncbi:MAG: serine/threonine protein kinase [Acidobacteria bacterium]|nr:MAG: serine/threonine protein kinase [Acidobacteriota bacterium]